MIYFSFNLPKYGQICEKIYPQTLVTKSRQSRRENDTQANFHPHGSEENDSKHNCGKRDADGPGHQDVCFYGAIFHEFMSEPPSRG